jgi:hypothetical protein
MKTYVREIVCTKLLNIEIVSNIPTIEINGKYVFFFYFNLLVKILEDFL